MVLEGGVNPALGCHVSVYGVNRDCYFHCLQELLKPDITKVIKRVKQRRHEGMRTIELI